MGGSLVERTARRCLVAILSLLLVGGAAPLTAATPAAATGGAPTVTTSDPTESLTLVPGTGPEPAAPDLESAVIAAEVLGEPVEILGRTTEYARHLANPDGTVTFDAYLAPQRVRKDDAWVPVDTTLRVENGRVVPGATLLDVSLSAGGTDELLVLVDGDHRLGLTWPQTLPTPVLSGDTATYPEVKPGIDIVVTVGAESVGLVIVVKERAAGLHPDMGRLSWQVTTDGVTVHVDDDGGIEVRSETTGEPVFVAPPSVMWDSPHLDEAPDGGGSGDPVAPADLGPGRMETVQVEYADGELAVIPDLAMLADPDTVYPVMIDPSFTRKATNWAPVFKTQPNSSWPSGTAQPRNQIRVGNLNWSGCGSWCGVWRSHMRFHIEDITGSGYKVVKNPEFTITLQHSASCSATPVALWRTNTIGSGSVTWNSMKDKWLTNFGTKSAKANKGACPQPDATMTWSTSSMKDKLQSAMDAGNTTFTFGLRAPDESDGMQWKYFDPASPRFKVTYNSVPDTPTSVKPQDGCAGSCSSPVTMRITRPTLQAKVRNELGGKVTAEFQLRDRATDEVVATGTTTVSNNTVATWRTPTLTNGKEYRFRVRARNADGINGPWSSYVNLTVDTSGPQTPGAIGVDSAADCYQSCDSPAVLRADRPTFRATPQHPFGDATDVVFEVHPVDEVSVLASATRAASPTGVKQTWQPSSPLPEGELRLRVRSVNDVHGRSGSWSPWYHFTIDTQAPPAPTVSSPLYAHKDTGTWNGGVGQPGVFHFGPAGADDVVTYQWRWNGEAQVHSADVPKGSSHTLVLAPPGDLEQLLEVRTVDHAGWTSPWQAYPFYVKPQPADAGYWKFDEGGGTVAASAVGGPELAGQLRGGATWAPSGINPDDPQASGTAVLLDGATAYVEMPPVVTTDHPAGFSVSAWVRPDVFGGDRTVLAQRGADTWMFRLYYRHASGQWCFQVRHADDPTSGTTETCSTVTPQTGEWTHLVGVVDGPAGVLRLWVNGGPNNGLPVPGDVTQTTAPTAWAATGSFEVGRAFTGDHFAGRIDEVRAYQRVVPEVEVLHMFQRCRLADCPPAPDPDALVQVGAWDFEETGGDVAADSSQLGNHATRSGDAQWTAFGHAGSRGVWIGDQPGSHLVTAGPTLATDRSFTVSAWVRLDELSGTEQWVVQTDGVDGPAVQLSYHPAAGAWRLAVTSHDGVAATWHQVTGGTPQPGVWTHLVGVYDAAAGELRLYVDGQLAGSRTQVATQAATGGLRIGGGPGATPLRGTVDAVRAYQGAATPDQVAQWYADQSGTGVPLQLLGDWRADEQAGQTVFDHTFSGNDGTLTGGASWPAPVDAYAGRYGVSFDGATGAVPTWWPPVATDDPFTVSAWVNLTDTGADRVAVAIDGTQRSAVTLGYLAAEGRFCLTMAHHDTPSAPASAACAAQPATTGVWTHLVGVFDRDHRRLVLYVDGQPAGSAVFGGLETWRAQGPLTLGRGTLPGGQSAWWAGGVARVQTYRGAMDPMQVAGLYEAQLDLSPAVTIDTPEVTDRWSAGAQISFSGQAFDASGPLPAGALSWQLRLRDCGDPDDPACQAQVLASWQGVAGGSFTAPDVAEPAWLELELTAVNDHGVASTVVRLEPVTVAVEFTSDPEGLELTVGSVTAPAPFTVALVPGATVEVAAAPQQALDGTTFVFDGWAHGGAAVQEIVVPAQPGTFTVAYREFDLTPTAVIDQPSPTQTWVSHQQISFSGSAFNTEGPLPVDDLSWRLWVEYCLAPKDCRLEVLQTWTGVAAGSFTAPDVPGQDAVLVLELTARVGTDLIGVAVVELARTGPGPGNPPDPQPDGHLTGTASAPNSRGSQP